MGALIVIGLVLGLIAFDLAAWRWGVDSNTGSDSAVRR